MKKGVKLIFAIRKLPASSHPTPVKDFVGCQNLNSKHQLDPFGLPGGPKSRVGANARVGGLKEYQRFMHGEVEEEIEDFYRPYQKPVLGSKQLIGRLAGRG